MLPSNFNRLRLLNQPCNELLTLQPRDTGLDGIVTVGVLNGDDLGVKGDGFAIELTGCQHRPRPLVRGPNLEAFQYALEWATLNRDELSWLFEEYLGGRLEETLSKIILKRWNPVSLAEDLLLAQDCNLVAWLPIDMTGLGWSMHLGHLDFPYNRAVRVESRNDCNDRTFLKVFDRSLKVLTPNSAWVHPDDLEELISWIRLNYDVLADMFIGFEAGTSTEFKHYPHLKRLNGLRTGSSNLEKLVGQLRKL